MTASAAPGVLKAWAEVVRPIVDHWDLCAKLNLDFVEKPEGCKALASIVRDMARIIDEEITRRAPAEVTEAQLQRVDAVLLAFCEAHRLTADDTWKLKRRVRAALAAQHGEERT